MRQLNTTQIETPTVENTFDNCGIKALFYDADKLDPAFFDRPLSKVIFVDDRQRKGHHDEKHSYLNNQGFELETHRLIAGDYASDSSNVTIDTKQVEELITCFGKEYGRFKASLEKANGRGYRMYVVVEGSGFKNLDDFGSNYLNPECYGNEGSRKECPWKAAYMCDPTDRTKPCQKWMHMNGQKPISAQRIASNIRTCIHQYDFDIYFCDKCDTGAVILELLFGMKPKGTSKLNK